MAAARLRADGAADYRRSGAAEGEQSLEIREIGHEDPEIARMPVRPEVMASRIRQNATCLGAFKKK